MSEAMRVGWAEVDLTPDRKVELAGQFAARISECVESPVTATALAVESAGEQMVICSCDLVAVSGDLLREIRGRLEGRVDGLDLDKVVIGATHTHTSVGFKRMLTSRLKMENLMKRFFPEEAIRDEVVARREDVMGEDEAFDHLAERVASSVAKAWLDRKPGAFANAFGRAVVGHCRRVVYNDGSALMWGDTNQATFEELEGGSDSGLELLYFFDENSNPTGVVVNVACPAQCVQHRRFVSSDYWGEVKVSLRKRFGDDFRILGLCGAGGDQCPVDMIRWVEPESALDDPNISRDRLVKRKADPSMFDIVGKKKTAARIANEVIAVYAEGLDDPVRSPVFAHETHEMKLPLRRVTPSEYKASVREMERIAENFEGRLDFNDLAKAHIHAGTIARFEYQRDHDLVSIETHVIRLGDVAIATNPFELFLNYGNQIKARSLAEQTFIIQLACGSEGYLPTRKAEQGGHYSAYVSSGVTGHLGGELLVRNTLERVNRLWRRPEGDEAHARNGKG